MLVWPGTYLRLEGAATWRVLRPGGVRLVNHHCERQPRLAAILAAHICKSNKRNATPISTNMKQSEGDVNLTSQWRMHVSICSCTRQLPALQQVLCSMARLAGVHPHRHYMVCYWAVIMYENCTILYNNILIYNITIFYILSGYQTICFCYTLKHIGFLVLAEGTAQIGGSAGCNPGGAGQVCNRANKVRCCRLQG